MRRSALKTLSLGVVIPDITFQLAKEDAQMALFSPYDVERLYGKSLWRYRRQRDVCATGGRRPRS